MQTSANASKWQFERKLIEEESPSRKDGISLRKENSSRRLALAFCQDVGCLLKMNQYTIATAFVYWQRFFVTQSLSRNDPYLIAAACLLLAGKVEENFKSLQKITETAYFVRNKKDPKAEEAIKSSQKLLLAEMDRVVKAEEVLLITMNFDFFVSHPYRPLCAIVKDLGFSKPSDDGRNTQFCQIAWNFANDSLRTTLCLQPFRPTDIAAACINLAASTLKIKLPQTAEGSHWWARYDVTAEVLKDVELQVMSLYRRKDGDSKTPTSCISLPATPSLSTQTIKQQRTSTPSPTSALDVGEVEVIKEKIEAATKVAVVEVSRDVAVETRRGLGSTGGVEGPKEKSLATSLIEKSVNVEGSQKGIGPTSALGGDALKSDEVASSLTEATGGKGVYVFRKSVKATLAICTASHDSSASKSAADQPVAAGEAIQSLPCCVSELAEVVDQAKDSGASAINENDVDMEIDDDLSEKISSKNLSVASRPKPGIRVDIASKESDSDAQMPVMGQKLRKEAEKVEDGILDLPEDLISELEDVVCVIKPSTTLHPGKRLSSSRTERHQDYDTKREKVIASFGDEANNHLLPLSPNHRPRTVALEEDKPADVSDPRRKTASAFQGNISGVVDGWLKEDENDSEVMSKDGSHRIRNPSNDGTSIRKWKSWEHEENHYRKQSKRPRAAEGEFAEKSGLDSECKAEPDKGRGIGVGKEIEREKERAWERSGLRI